MAAMGRGDDGAEAGDGACVDEDEEKEYGDEGDHPAPGRGLSRTEAQHARGRSHIRPRLG